VVLSTQQKYLAAHSLVLGAFRECVYVFVVLGRRVSVPLSESSDSVFPTPSTAKQRKSALIALLSWLYKVCDNSEDAVSTHADSSPQPSCVDISIIAVDIVGEVLLFPPDAGANVARERVAVAVAYRVAAVGSVALWMLEARGKEHAMLARRQPATGPAGLCARLIGLVCDVAMLDQSETVRARALEGLVQAHCVSLERAGKVAAVPPNSPEASQTQQWFRTRLTTDVLQVLLLKCGDICPKVSGVAIRTLLHEVTAEGMLVVLKSQSESNSRDVPHTAAVAVPFLLEATKFLVQLYCHRFACFVATTASSGCGDRQPNVFELLSQCRSKEEDLYQLCQSISEYRESKMKGQDLVVCPHDSLLACARYHPFIILHCISLY